MRWLLITAVAASCAASHLHAQVQAEPPTRTRIRVTPFVGTTLPLASSGTFVLGDTTVAFQEEGAAAALAGLELEVPVRGSFSVVAGGAASNAGNVVLRLRVAEIPGEASFLFHGTRSVFGKLGVRYRLPEPTPDTRRRRPSGSLTLAPAVMNNFFDSELGGGRETVFGLSLGAEALSRFGESPFSLHVGVENFVGLTSDTDNRRIITLAPRAFAIESGRTNTLAFRLGVTYSR